MARMGQWEIFNDPALDAFFYVPPVAASIPYAPKTGAASTPEETPESAKAEGVAMFASWLERNMPEVFRAVIITGPEYLMPEFALSGMSLSGLAEDPANPAAPSTDWGTKIFDLLETVLPQYAAYRSQREIIRLNVARAEQGLPPLDSGAVAPQVQVGLTSDTSRLLMFGGLAALAVFLLAGRRR